MARISRVMASLKKKGGGGKKKGRG